MAAPETRKTTNMIRKTNGLCALIALGAFTITAPALAAGPRNGTTLASYKTIDICVVNENLWRYSGEFSVWNEGSKATVGLTAEDCIQTKVDGEQFEDVLELCTIDFEPPLEEIPAGTTEQNATSFAYSVEGPALNPEYIRNVVYLTIDNHSGSVGTAKGPSPKATWIGGEPPPCAPPPPPSNCTYTQGYWKNHGSWPAPYTPSMAFYAGINVEPDQYTWQETFDTPPAGNAYYNLAHQTMSALLNMAKNQAAGFGNPPLGVLNTIVLADNWLATNPPAACPTGGSCGTQKTWAKVLDDYNNGIYPGGPPHCPDE
jgi:hypothetical protein